MLKSSTIFGTSQEKNNKNSISDRTEETEFDDYINSASDEQAKSIVDAVDKELLGDAMYYGTGT